MDLSIIIPTYNEADIIGETIDKIFGRLSGSLETEIIVSDGGSTDQTTETAIYAGASVVWSSEKGRGIQMNRGAEKAQGTILYFLHSDSIPPYHFDRQIMDQVKAGNTSGCFRLRFDSDHSLLRFYAWFTRFDLNAFRFGDQSLFVTRTHFQKAGKFREDLVVMEDNEIIGRLKKTGSFVILPDYVSTSARKYRKNGAIRLQLIFTMIYLLYHLGISQEKLVKLYKRFIKS